MAGGQAIDLDAVGKPLTVPELEFMHIHKTGAIIRAALQLGVRCGRALDETDRRRTKQLEYNREHGINQLDIGAAPSGVQTIVPGDFIVVNNLGDQPPVDAYDCSGQCNRAQVASISGNDVTLAKNPFVAQTPPMPSPSYRFQVVSTVVTYHCAPNANGSGTLTRYAGYAIQVAQPVSTAALAGAPSAALMANQVARCAFSFDTLPNLQRGLVSVSLTLGAPGGNAGQLTLVQQAQVNNSP